MDHDPAAVLACPMGKNDADVATIGEYLAKLLLVLWAEKDTFSGKRPFGNSDWTGEIEVALIAAGMVQGSLDEDGYLDDVDDDAVDRLIRSAITAMGSAT
jgi:hypothetical protein